MTMKDRFFSTYQLIVYKRCFYREHYAKAYKYNIEYSAALIVISLLAATIWGISKSQPVVWAFIIGAAQLAQSFAPLLPWTNQLNALNYLLPELESLLVDLDNDWLSLDLKEYNDIEIQELVSKYEKKYCELENQYLGTLYFSEPKSITDAAGIAETRYLNIRYPANDEADAK